MSKLWRTHTTFILIAGILAIIIATAVAFMVTTFEPKTEVRLGTAVFKARLADDSDERIQGLSGVSSLRANEALLMAFDTDREWGIWMKDMQIPLDILWLDKDRKVVHVVKNASPDLGTSTTFTPTEPARYVLEVNAGMSTAYNIKVGDEALFALPGEGVAP